MFVAFKLGNMNMNNMPIFLKWPRAFGFDEFGFLILRLAHVCLRMKTMRLTAATV